MKSSIANKVLDIIGHNLEQQVNKGHSKYGHYLDDCPDDKYEWQQMVIEELIDGMQYMVKENSILRKDNRELRKELVRLRLLNKGQT